MALHPRTYNWLILPLVILVRLPILMPFIILRFLGERAERCSDVVAPWLPGIRYNPDSKSRF